MIPNAQLVHAATGLRKEAGTFNLGDVNFDGILPVEYVHPMIDQTRDYSGILKAVNSFTVSQMKGTVPIYAPAEKVMKFTKESGTKHSVTRGTTRKADYVTQKIIAELVITHEQLREARKMPTGGDWETKIITSWQTQLGNNVADAVVNGQLASPDDSLNGFDGILAQLQAGSNVVNRGGAPFDKRNFPAIYDRIPRKWRNDKSMMKWFYADRIDNWYRDQLTTKQTGLGDDATSTASTIAPMGIKPILVPQISDEDGPTAIAPTSVADNTTYLTIVLTTLVTAGDPASHALGVGRRFLVEFPDTGQTEIVEGYLNGSSLLTVDTAGLLGQTGTPSTTAGDYTVRPADETTIILGDPMGLSIIWLDEWRMYREYKPKDDQLDITVYLELAFLAPTPEMFVLATNIAAPPVPFEPAA